MEAIGGVASIIALVETTEELVHVSKKLVSRWQNAPCEIQTLATRLNLLAGELHSIETATSTSHPILTDAIIRQSLDDLLTDVRKRLVKLESLHFDIKQQKPFRQRMTWTVKDASFAEKMLSKTQEVEQRLANLMTLISLKAQTPILDGLDRIERVMSTLVVSLPASNHMVFATSATCIAHGSPTKPTRPPRAARRILTSSSWILDKSWEPWGLRVNRITTRTASCIDHNINFSITVPFVRILGNYALTGSLSLQTTPLCWGFLTFCHPSYFAAARVVSKYHPFMKACRLGDTETVRLMLRSGEGRPTDVTANGMTPIYYAVCHSRIEVMTELLNSGTDVEAIASTGAMGTALDVAMAQKDLDVARFLLGRGASAERRIAAGLRSSALCWGRSDDATQHSSLEIFRLCYGDEALEQEGDDPNAFTALQLAAAGACGSQIEQLILLGSDVHDGLWRGIAPIHSAAFNGDHAAYSVLASYYDDDFFKTSHAPSLYLLFTMLTGKAKRLAHSQVTDYLWFEPVQDFSRILLDLLQRGVDPTSRLRVPVWLFECTPPDIRGRVLSANELAGCLGPQTEAWYLSILNEFYSSTAHEVLCESGAAACGTTEFVCGLVEETDENKPAEESKDKNDGPGIEGNSTEAPQTRYDDDDIVDSEAEQFWDANEIA